MRVIAGEFRHRKLNAPEGYDTTRPITDRVKQSLFDRLTVRGLVDDGFVLDLFAGSGSMGIEALSRGSDFCTFVEKSRKVWPVLEGNLSSLGLEDYSQVLRGDVLAGGWLNQVGRQPVKLVFCDPPYALAREGESMARLATLLGAVRSIMTPEALLVLRTDEQAAPGELPGFAAPETFTMGGQVLRLYPVA